MRVKQGGTDVAELSIWGNTPVTLGLGRPIMTTFGLLIGGAKQITYSYQVQIACQTLGTYSACEKHLVQPLSISLSIYQPNSLRTNPSHHLMSCRL